MSLPPASPRADETVPPTEPLPLHDARKRAFDEPWEAQVFALTLMLQERGCFSWREWTDALSAAIDDAETRGAHSAGGISYARRLDALERLVAGKGLCDRDTLKMYRDAWLNAAERTRHGEPIALSAADFACARADERPESPSIG